MIILVTGASHTGKTVYAQKLLEKYHYPYLSIDHLKMGLIRSGMTTLTPMDDKELTPYLWKILREIIKTALENQQNLIIEGCYIPFDWEKDFCEEELNQIMYYCLIMTESYIRKNFHTIKAYANTIEQRLIDTCDMNALIAENNVYLDHLLPVKKHHPIYIIIDENYPMDVIEISNKR